MQEVMKMAKENKLLVVKTYNTNQKPDETLERYYRRLAKAADERLVRLEKYSKEKYFEPAKDWAYASAMRDIHTWNGQTASRFNTAPPTNPEKLVAKINDIKKFLESPTSTKVGIKNAYIKKVNTFNERYGTDLTWDELAKYYDRRVADRMSAKFGSKTALKVIGRIQDKMNETGKSIDEISYQDIKTSNPDVIELQVKEALWHNKKLLKQLL